MISRISCTHELVWCLNKHAELVCDSLEINNVQERDIIINSFEKKIDRYLNEIEEGNSEFLLNKNDKNELTGFVWIKYSSNAYTKKGNIYIMNIFIDKKYRRRGIANELVTEVKRIAFTNNITNIFCQIEIDNEISLELFRKNGFKEKSKVLEIDI